MLFRYVIAILIMTPAVSYAGPVDDEKVLEIILTCQKFYKEQKIFVYDYDVKQLDAILKTAEREVEAKYSQDDVLKLYIKARFSSQDNKPKGGDYEKALNACRKYVNVGNEKIKSKGKLLD